jgi:hypothetical protein
MLLVYHQLQSLLPVSNRGSRSLANSSHVIAWSVVIKCRAERTLRCDYNSRLCATRGGLKMQKMKSTFRKPKVNKKLDKTSSSAAGAGLRLRPKSACPTGVGLGATGVGLCHRSGLRYLSHGFQTQGTVAARAGLKVRPESACVPRPWIWDPRYGCHRSGLEGATEVNLRTWAMDFRPKVWLPP